MPMVGREYIYIYVKAFMSSIIESIKFPGKQYLGKSVVWGCAGRYCFKTFGFPFAFKRHGGKISFFRARPRAVILGPDAGCSKSRGGQTQRSEALLTWCGLRLLVYCFAPVISRLFVWQFPFLLAGWLATGFPAYYLAGVILML